MQQRNQMRLVLSITIITGVLIVVYNQMLGVKVKVRISDLLKAGGESRVKSKVESKVKSKVESKVKSKVESKIKSKVESKVKSNVKSKVDSLVKDDVEGRQLIFSELGKPWATYMDKVDDEDLHPNGQNQTSDHWPVFSKPYYKHDIPRSPYRLTHIPKLNFDTAAFLEKPHVKGKPPKLITWYEKSRPIMDLPEAVRLRMCPEMPCRLTTNRTWWRESAALLWNAEIMIGRKPPPRAHPDQVFVLQNHEPQTTNYWARISRFRTKPWNKVFNWTWTYRTDSDIMSLYGYIVRRHTPVTKNFTSLVASKAPKAAWQVSNCRTGSRRMKYVRELKKYYRVDVYGRCGTLKCPRSADYVCTDKISKYRYYLSFESQFCTDYITEKFFKFFNEDVIPIVRGSNEYKFHAPKGTYINTADFKSPKDLAAYLKHLDSHPDEYEAILRRKAQWIALQEDWPIRDFLGSSKKVGRIDYMEVHFQAIGYCDLCRRLWELDSYRKSVADMGLWIDKANCRKPDDLNWTK